MVKLYSHQLEGIDLAVKNNGVVGLFFGCGTGKTIMALSTYDYYLTQNKELKLFVICPLTLITNAWIDDLKHFPHLTFQNLHDDMKTFKNVNVYLINYESFIREEKLIKIKKFLASCTTMCILDESQRIKNSTSQTTKKILSIRDLFKHRILLSGTPSPNDETELWAQLRFLNEDLVHKSFYAFRNTYFHLQRGKQIMEVPNGSFVSKDMARKIFAQGFKYEISPKKRIELMNKIRPFCMYKALEDCVDLPESVEIIRKIALAGDQAATYKAMKTELVAELKGQYIAAPFALTKLSKLRQITSGFLLTSSGDPIDLDNNAKLDELMQVLDEIGNEQSIIWTWFQHEADVIKSKLGATARIINGTVTEAEKNEAIQLFKDGTVQRLICNPLSVGFGITLTNCHYSIYYSLSYSHEQHYQSIHRIRRISQKNKCIYIYLLADNTIDCVIFDVLKRKGDENEIVKELLK